MPSRDPENPSGGDDATLRAARRRGDGFIGRCLVGKFVIRELIGEGPASRVYRADQIALNRPVAIKLLRPGGPSTEGAGISLAQRFHDQAFAVSRLFHPNVVAVYDYGHTRDGLLYIAMEYLQGRTLGSLVRDGLPISLTWIADIMSQVLKALEEAHAAGVIHAHLKSDNIVVEELRDGRSLAKVLDFGIAYLFQSRAGARGASAAVPQITAASPEYMAPELIGGAAPDPACDIYSAGIVLHELVTGTLPLDKAVEPRIERAAADGASDVREIARNLVRIAQRASAREPGDRFADVAAFRAAVEAALEDLVKSATCQQCGTQNEAQFRFCAECGARLASAGESPQPDGQIERTKSEAKRMFAAGNTGAAVDAMHRAVGRAIRLRDRDLILDCYLTLGLIHAETGATQEAIKELEEAVDIVTSGPAGGAADVAPQSLWQAQLQLAKLYHAIGRQRFALAMCSRALVSARQMSSTNGRKSVQSFMTQLHGEVRRASERSLEKLSAPETHAGDDQLFSGPRSLQPFLDESETSPWIALEPAMLDDDADGEPG